MINTNRLRSMIGWLAIALPWIVMLIVRYVPRSISATYYTQAQAVFMIILGSASMLLISYKGYELEDDVINTAAGFCGLCICLFPCSVEDPGSITGTFSLPMNVSNIIHCTTALIFFGLLAVNSLFLFTRTKGQRTKRKRIRDRIYRTCGIGMLASFVPILFKSLIGWDCLTWAVETTALLFFGISWLTKANIYPWLAAESK